MGCQEREALWNEYETALRYLTRCVDSLSAATALQIGTKIAEAQVANQLCKEARELWAEHIEKHRCDAAGQYKPT